MKQLQNQVPSETLTKSKTGRKDIGLTNSPKLSHEQIRDALFRVQDHLERSQIQFVLLDEIAKQMREMEDPLLEASEVSIGIRSQDFTQSGSSTLRSIIPDAGWEEFLHGETISNLAYQDGSVPVVIWIIHNDLDVFKNPDTKFYYQTEFRLPNPFKTYWRVRDLIK